MQLAGRAGPQAGAFNFRFFRKLLTEWHIWLFTITYSLYIFAQSKLDASIYPGKDKSPHVDLFVSDRRPAAIDVILAQILSIAYVYRRTDQLVSFLSIRIFSHISPAPLLTFTFTFLWRALHPHHRSYPSGIWATQIVSALSFAWLSDTLLRGRRWPPLLLVAIWHSVDTAILAGLPVYQDNRAVRWVFYYLSGVVK
jgi:hypothetical protein